MEEGEEEEPLAEEQHGKEVEESESWSPSLPPDVCLLTGLTCLIVLVFFFQLGLSTK